MPALPTDWTAECIELRNITSSTASNNTLSGGSIGISIVSAANITASSNNISNSQLEGIEFGQATNCSSISNVINGSAQVGELIDGSTGSNGIIINGDIISNTTKECIQAYKGTQNLTIKGCNLSVASGAYGVNLIGSNMVSVQSTTLNGNGVGKLAIMLDTCPGNVTITGGSISNLKSCVVGIYNVTAGSVTNNVTMSGVTVSGVPNALSTYLLNGATVGSNIVVVNH
jgi:parallel beta-helix repeat protein